MSVRRVYVEKKPEFAVKAGELREEISSYLSIGTVSNVRVLIRYDIENLSEETYRQALVTIFPSRRLILYMKRIFQRKREIPYFPLNICQDSLTRGLILQSSV